MYISWGPEFVQFYNDAYRPVLGSKHPGALGRSTFDTWSEIWDDIVGPLFRKVKVEGEATYLEDFHFPLHRYGYTEECYFTFCYSPIREESGAAGGVFVTCIETTPRMVGERRLRTLRELASRAGEARTAAEACRSAASVLASNLHDLPFAAIYLVDDEASTAHLAGMSGLDDGHAAFPPAIDLRADAAAAWPLGDVAQSGRLTTIDVPPRWEGTLPAGPWPEAPGRCSIVPVLRAGQDRLAAIVIAGLSARRPFDDDYRGFLELVGGHLTRVIASAEAYEAERRRAEALAELDRAKTAFFSNVSHEFRTPLTLLLGPTEEVLMDSVRPLDAEHRERITVAHRNALRLLRLVNTLLDFSRIEAGRIDAVYEPTDLAALTTDLASGFRSAVERAGLRFRVDATPIGEPVYVDREMWEKVVLNLLSNALKHTFDGEIVVSVRRVGNAAELAVRDTGVGIAADQLPRIFERFHRIAGARSRTHEGSGIGLALVQELVRLHGGSVHVESRENEGSAFSVRIPLGSAHLPAERLEAERERESTSLGAVPFVEEALRWTPGGASGATQMPAERGGIDASSPAVAPATLETPNARILLADDNADMREYVTRLLAQRGWMVEGVADGHSALARAVADPPDLIVTDVMMPGLDGVELLRAIRARRETRTIPVVILSARAGEASQVEGLESGADDYLVKPFTAQELVARINTHLALARLRRETEAEKTRLLAEAQHARAELEVKAVELEETAAELEMQSEELRSTTEELQQVNQRLTVSEARLRLANLAAGIGTWELTIDTGAFECDEQCRSVLALARESPIYDNLASVAHPHDRDRVRAVLEHARTRQGEGGPADFAVEFRLADTGAVAKWISLTGRTLFEPLALGGRAVRVVGSVHDVTTRHRAEEALREETQIVETIQRVGGALASKLDLGSLVQTVTDEATRLTGAEFGAFFYNVLNESGESYMLYTISGVPRAAFERFPMPRNTAVFEPTFRGTGVVRSDDITQDPRYGKNAPYYGKPKGHLPVVSYLAVPVVSRAGEVLGGLFFGHSARGVFSERHERLAVGVAGWAALAIDNARLYDRERRARGEAEGARQDAETANRAKTEFLATMSHELRTPLNAIAGYVDLLDMELRGPVTEEQRGDLHRIQRSQRHLLSLINDILNFAKLEAGQVELHPTTIAVNSLLGDIEQLVAPQLAAKSLKYQCTDCDPSLAIRADEEKTRQIILNLLTNAMKFTDAGGSVSVECRASESIVELRVSDTGRGIPTDKLDTIFEPFVQVDRHLTPTGQQGVGLGLAISRDLARAMGGDIEVTSAVGQGSTFALTLPRVNA
jgi:signal transduction histidine kinase/DNA-binding response OmpR family regulator